MVVDFSAAGLDNEYIFASNRLLDLNASLAYSKLSEENFRGWYAELVTISVAVLDSAWVKPYLAANRLDKLRYFWY